jgi:hypothetical protein
VSPAARPVYKSDVTEQDWEDLASICRSYVAEWGPDGDDLEPERRRRLELCRRIISEYGDEDGPPREA